MNLPINGPTGGATGYADVIARSIALGRNDAIVVVHSAGGLFLPRRMTKKRPEAVNSQAECAISD
jgi:hypothetical protein